MLRFFLTILAIAIILGVGYIISKRKAPEKDGVHRLRLHPIVPLACLAFFGLFIFIVTQTGFRNQPLFEQAGIVFIFGVIIIGTLTAFFEEIRYGPDGIFTRSLFRGRRSFDWVDIVDLKDGSGLGKKVVTSQGSFEVSDFMPGSRDFLAEVETIVGREKLYGELSGILATEPIETDPGGHAVVHHFYKDFFEEATVVEALNQKFFDLSDRCPTQVHEIVLVLAAILTGRHLYDIPMDQPLAGFTETERDLEPDDDCDEDVLGSIRMWLDDCLCLLHPKVNWYEVLCPDFEREPQEDEIRVLNHLAEKALAAIPPDSTG